jgi:general secretion pathway protein F
VVIEQAEARIVRERFAAVRAEVVAGQTLASALTGYPRDFPEVYRALVAAGEQSGDLAGVMSRLADYIESRSALVQKVALSFIYPAIVTAVAAAVVVVLLTYVVPQVIDVFRQTGQALPWLTQALIVVSDFSLKVGALRCARPPSSSPGTRARSGYPLRAACCRGLKPRALLRRCRFWWPRASP